jgi:hypothetical protein
LIILTNNGLDIDLYLYSLMKLGGSLGNVPQKLKIYRVFITSFFNLCEKLPSDPPNVIKLL